MLTRRIHTENSRHSRGKSPPLSRHTRRTLPWHRSRTGSHHRSRSVHIHTTHWSRNRRRWSKDYLDHKCKNHCRSRIRWRPWGKER